MSLSEQRSEKRLQQNSLNPAQEAVLGFTPALFLEHLSHNERTVRSLSRFILSCKPVLQSYYVVYCQRILKIDFEDFRHMTMLRDCEDVGEELLGLCGVDSGLLETVRLAVIRRLK